MRKLLALTLAMFLLLTLLAGCDKSTDEPTTEASTNTVEETPTEQVTDWPTTAAPTDEPTIEPTVEPTEAPADVEPAVVTDPVDPSLFSMFTKVKEPLEFPDLFDTDYYYTEANLMTSYGLISGSDGLFQGEEPIKRVEAMILAVRVYCIFNGIDLPPAATEDELWYDPYVDFAEANGIYSDFKDIEAYATYAEVAQIYASALPADVLPCIVAVDAIEGMKATDAGFAEALLLFRAGVLDSKTFVAKDEAYRSDACALYLARMVIPEMRLTGDSE